MRRMLLVLGTALALAVMVNPVNAQLKFGVQGGVITGMDEVLVAGTDVNSINGTFGLGGRVMLDPPLFPLGVVGSATYYFTEDTEASFYTATLAAQLRIPLPVVKPYVLGGWQIRRTGALELATPTESSSESGPVVGAGVQLSFAVSLFLEGTFEISDDIQVTGIPDISTNRFVIKGGLMFG